MLIFQGLLAHEAVSNAMLALYPVSLQVCDWCGGDKKSIDMTYGETTKTSLRAALKCTACNENGLCPCPDCVIDSSF